MFNFCSWAPFQNLRPSSSISLVSLNQIATIQPKNLTKTIKTFIMVIVFLAKNSILLPKNHVLLEKLKLIFL